MSEYEPEDTIALGGLTLTFSPTVHSDPCNAIRVTDGRASLVYGADGSPSDALVRFASDVDLLLLEATFADDAQTAAAHGHMTARQAGEVAAAAGARRLVLTHLLPREPQLREVAEQAYDGPVELAREGLSYDLG